MATALYRTYAAIEGGQATYRIDPTSGVVISSSRAASVIERDALSGGTVEHAVIVHLPLDNAQFGSVKQGDALNALEDELFNAVELAEAGEFDGNEFGEGECVFYLYGADADTLYQSIELVLKASPVARGGYAIKRYGPAQDRNSKEVRVTW